VTVPVQALERVPVLAPARALVPRVELPALEPVPVLVLVVMPPAVVPAMVLMLVPAARPGRLRR
jgi:hypothetical protein